MRKHFISVAFFFDIVMSTSRLSPRWTYEDESKWPGEKCHGAGVRQSPINIRKADVIKDFKRDFIKYGELKFNGYHVVHLSGINNGLTIMFSTEGEETTHPTVTGGPLRYQYRLEQLHFHWLSEHALDGVKFPVEIHFVHVRTDLIVGDALRTKNGLVIMSVFCKLQETDDSAELMFEELMQYLPKLAKVGSRVRGAVLNITSTMEFLVSNLLSPDTDMYYTYAGSLTTPLCNEVVIWIIFPEHIYISESQFNLLEKASEGRYNFRKLQKITYHMIYQPPANFFSVPQIVTSIKNAGVMVVEFFKDITSFMAKGLTTP